MPKHADQISLRTRAFVRTGFGGVRVIRDGGALVIRFVHELVRVSLQTMGFGGVRVIRDGGALVMPFVHELVRVSLQTIKLELQRENEVALITKDRLRAEHPRRALRACAAGCGEHPAGLALAGRQGA